MHKYRRFTNVTFAGERMIMAKGLPAGRHIFLETTYRRAFLARRRGATRLRDSGKLIAATVS